MTRARWGAWLLLLASPAAPCLAQAEISIVDAAPVVEGDSGTVDAVFVVTIDVPAFRKAAAPITVTYTTEDGSATVADGDYQADTMGSIICDDVAMTCPPIVISVNGDMKIEDNEDFSVRLLSATPPAMLVGQTVGVGTIMDDGDTTEISIGDAMVMEGAAGASPSAMFPVTLSNPSAFFVTVDFATEDGTATTGDMDYLAAMGQVTFAPGSTLEMVSVVVNGDAKIEPDETFFVDLSNPDGAGVSLGDAEGEGTIQNDDAATLSMDDVTVTEGDGGMVDAVFTVTLSAESVSPVMVDFATRDGTATSADNDYQPTSGQLLFAPQATTAQIVVNVNGDDLVEPDESFFVDLTNPMGMDVTLGDDEGEGTIANDDMATISIGDVTVTEGGAGTTTDAVFDVTLSAESAGPVTVDFATRDGTAAESSDNDYQLATGQVAFPAGSTSQTVTVKVNGDATVEPDETFFVDLANPGGTGVSLGDAEGEGTIENDDGTMLSIDDAAVTEGDAGTVDALFTVTLSAPSAGTVTVDFATRDGSATLADGDYQTAGGQLSFAPGSTTATVAVTVNGDPVVEPDESFFVDLSNPDGASIADGEGEGSIGNDDGAVLSIDDVTVTEGDAGTIDAVFSVTLSAPVAAEVTVGFATRDGTATTAGGDYAATSGQLVFVPGSTTRTVAVNVNGDAVVEPEESFFVDLANPEGATLGDGVGQGSIRNDDGATLAIDDVMVMEGDGGTTDAVLTVSLSAPSASVVTVDFATGDASATARDGDYRSASGRLVFSPGALTRTIAVPVLGDSTVEPDEVFLVHLSSPVGATIADGRGRVTIANDDRDDDEIRLLAIAATAEGAGPATVTAVRSGSGQGAASVRVETIAGSAQPGEDFRPRTRLLRWAAGETGAKTFDVRLLDDNVQEPDETVLIALSLPLGAVLAEPFETELVILDDDQPSGLEGVGELELSAGVGEELELTVRVIGEDGAPIACAIVAWEVVEGEAELVDGATAKSDDQGNAVKTVRLGAMPGTVTVSATLAPGQPAAAKSDSAKALVFTITVEGDLDQLFDGDSNPAESSVAEVLDDSCRDAVGSFAALCDFVFGLEDEADQRAVVRELTPREAVAQGDVSLDAVRAQLTNVGSRLAALRGGATRESVDQLALSLGGKPVPVAVLASAFSARRYESGFLDRFDAAVAALDPRQEEDAAGGADALAAVEQASRWGFFLNGQASFGDSPATELEEGFDLETLGLTAGLDYRVSDRLVVGGALGYLDLQAELDREGGSLDSRGLSLSVYSSYFRKAFYFDAIVTYGVSDFRLRRNIDLPLPFEGQTRLTALGDPDGSQLALAAAAGYDAAFGAATLGGFGRVSWIDGEVEGYSESGAGPFNLAIRDQEVESLLLEAGIEYTRAVSRSWGVLQPTLRASALHELEDASRLVRGRFVEDVSAAEFAVPTDQPDRDYFNLGAGLTAVLARGRSFFVFYDTDLARDDLEVYTLSFGLRLEL